jgi:hypothetical protein
MTLARPASSSPPAGGTVQLALKLLGTAAAIAGMTWFVAQAGWSATWDAFRRADWLVLLASVPLVLINMGLRALRWRSLLGNSRDVPFVTAFSAQMVGYLANNILPVRVGDLVRILVLGQAVPLSRSRILSTVLLERVLDMAMVVFLLTMMALVSPLPEWMRTAAAAVAAATLAGISVVIAVAIWGEAASIGVVRLVPLMSDALKTRLETWAREFSQGVQRFRRPSVAASFFAGTVAIWGTEIGLVLIVAKAMHLTLSPLHAAVLMLFSLFSSFIPALPGQIGTFELGMLTGLDFLGQSNPAALPFALVLHFVLLAGTSILGVICVLTSGLPLWPRRLLDKVRAQ